MQSRPTRILVIRFSSIGDIVLTAPALASLREAIEGPSEIHFLTKATMRPVVEGFGELVDQIHTIEHATAEVMDALRSAELDYIVDLHNNVRSRAVKRALGLISFTVDKQNVAKWLLVRGWRTQPVAHIVDRYIAAFGGAFGAKTPTQWPELFEGAHFNRMPSVPYAIIALGATHNGKRLTDSIIESIAQRENRSIVLIGGSEDRERGESWVRRFPDWHQFAGSTSIAESAALLRQAEHVYTGDTGMMHLAAAVGTPITSFWGCTRPNLGMGPWRAAADSQEVHPASELGNRPCSKLGNRACRHTPSCMEQTARLF